MLVKIIPGLNATKGRNLMFWFLTVVKKMNPRRLWCIENHTSYDLKNVVVLVPHGVTLWFFISSIRMSQYIV